MQYSIAWSIGTGIALFLHVLPSNRNRPDGRASERELNVLARSLLVLIQLLIHSHLSQQRILHCVRPAKWFRAEHKEINLA